MTKANPIIASVPCPVIACGKTCDVRKFAQRAITDSGKRKAGKLYFDCPTHGRFGFDGKEAMQDYVLHNMKWLNESDAPPPAIEPAAKKLPPAPAKPRPIPPPPPPIQPPAPRKWWQDI